MSIPTPSRIIGIDPGFDRMGVAVVEGGSLLFSVCLMTDKKKAHEERLYSLGSELRKIIGKWRPKGLAIEKLFFNQNTTNALKVAEARGVALYEAASAGIEVYEYSPQDVKIAVTGYGKADKKAVEDMVRKLVRFDEAPPSPKPRRTSKGLDDELDAVALCITHLATRRGI